MTESASTLLLLVALAYGALHQGAFYGDDAAVVEVIVAAATVVALISRRHRTDLINPFTLATVAIGGWALLSAAHTGGAAAASPVVRGLAGAAGAFTVVRGLDQRAQLRIVTGLVALGLVVAATGWWGVVRHHVPETLLDGGLWRAASTITYANGTAAFIVPITLVLFALHVERPRRSSGVLIALLAGGAAATLSRAGGGALLAGIVVITIWCGPLAVIRAGLGPAVGAAAIVAGLVPSMPATSRPHLGLALVGLGAGVVVTVALTRPWTARQLTIIGVGAVVGMGLLAAHGSAVGAVRRDRLTVDSPGRSREWHAATTAIAEHPLWGSGPGRTILTWEQSGQEFVAEFAHNEFLQTAADLGEPAVVMLVVAIGWLVVKLVRAQRAARASNETTRGLTVGALAAVTAGVIHANFDFTWHIVVIPIAFAATAALSPPRTSRYP